MEDAAVKIEAWRNDYNEYRPHSSLDDLTPVEFIEQCMQSKKVDPTLPGAPATDPMIFGAEEYLSSASEKSSDQLQLLIRSNAPKF